MAPLSVRYVRDGVRYSVRVENRANTGLCGMCGTSPIHVRARTRIHAAANSPRAYVRSRAYMTYRTYRTYRTHRAQLTFQVCAIPHSMPHMPHSTRAHAHNYLFLLALEKNREVVSW